MPVRTVSRVLVVEDHEGLLATLTCALGARFPEVRACRDVSAVRTALDGWRPDLVVTDVILPDGDALDVLTLLADGEGMPCAIAISGEATPDQSFELARRGVRIYLSKPLSLERLEAAVERALTSPPDLRPQLRQVVGHAPLHVVEGEIREVMVDEAMARTRGSRRAAARLLGISRQLLQHVLRRRQD